MVLTLSLLLLEKSPADLAKDAQKALAGDHRQAYVLALLGLAGTLTPVILSWFKDRSNVSRASQLLDEGVKRISFWDQWLKLSSLLGDDAAAQARQRVQHELTLLSDAHGISAALLHSEASALKQVKDRFTVQLSGLSGVRRVLLFYKPPRAVAWLPRFFFYLFSLFTLVLVLIGLILIPEWTILGEELMFAAFTAIFAVGFRALSIYTERPRQTTDDPAVTLPPAPLPPDTAV